MMVKFFEMRQQKSEVFFIVYDFLQKICVFGPLVLVLMLLDQRVNDTSKALNDSR